MAKPIELNRLQNGRFYEMVVDGVRHEIEAQQAFNLWQDLGKMIITEQDEPDEAGD